MFKARKITSLAVKYQQMSGHSKWSSIKHQKGAADQKRGIVFSKLTRAITVAARNGIDPEMNFQLRIAIDQARDANMPKDNIERAIERAKGVGGEALEEIIFEAYGPGGTAFIIESATDNRNRTVGEIRAILNKFEGKLAESGSVSFLFRKRGQIVLEGVDIEAAELAAIDAGAEDVEADEQTVIVYTDPKNLQSTRISLAEAGFESNVVSFEWLPITMITAEDEVLHQKIVKMSDLLAELEDVTRVFNNLQPSSA